MIPCLGGLNIYVGIRVGDWIVLCNYCLLLKPINSFWNWVIILKFTNTTINNLRPHGRFFGITKIFITIASFNKIVQFCKNNLRISSEIILTSNHKNNSNKNCISDLSITYQIPISFGIYYCFKILFIILHKKIFYNRSTNSATFCALQWMSLPAPSLLCNL